MGRIKRLGAVCMQKKKICKGEIILVEDPLAFIPRNVGHCCSNCMKKVQTAATYPSGPETGCQKVPTRINCKSCEDEVYCSSACAEVAWNSHHRLLCSQTLAASTSSLAAAEALSELKRLCRESGRIYSLLLARVLAQVVVQVEERGEGATFNLFLEPKHSTWSHLRHLTWAESSPLAHMDEQNQKNGPPKENTNQGGDIERSEQRRDKVSGENIEREPNVRERRIEEEDSSSSMDRGRVYPPEFSLISQIFGPTRISQVVNEELCGWLMTVLIRNTFGIWIVGEEEKQFIYTDRQEDGVGIYLRSSYFNHSCRPNVDRAHFAGNKQLGFVACEDVAAGEQLFIEYIDTRLPIHERRQMLALRYGFLCSCPRCLEEEHKENHGGLPVQE